MQNNNISWDLIIIGTGPAGLSASIFASRLGFHILLIEQGSHIGPFAGGETLRYDPILDRIFGPQLLERISIFKTFDTRIFSPNCKKLYVHHEKAGVNSFEWEDLIKEFEVLIKKSSVTLKTNTQVRNILQNDSGIAIGVESSTGEKFYAQTIVDASGAESSIHAKFLPEKNQLGYIIIKSIISNFTPDFPGYSTFFLMQGSLKSYPNFPPSTIFVFPHNNGRAEIGMMIFDNFYKNNAKELQASEILDVWHFIKAQYPIFSEMVKDTNVESERITKIGSKHLIDSPIIIPGYLLLGASGGFLDAGHAAGLLTGMREAEFWMTFLKEKTPFSWNNDFATQANSIFQKTKIYQEVAKTHRKIRPLTRLLYGILKTEKNFHRIWPIFVAGKKRMG